MSLAEDHFSEQTTLSFLINYLIMKSFLKKMVAAVSLVVAMVANVEAQNSFAYQAVIRTAKGELVSNKEIGMQFSLIYDGKVIYCETQKPTTNQYGNVQVEVGKGQKVSGSFADVPWSTMQVMMKIEADPNGGTNYIDLGTIQLQPAPYAMYAPAAGKVTTIQAGDPKSDSNALFEVKDKDGNVVFAVYPDGVRVFVDDSDSTAAKAMPTGFAVSGRKAAKEGEEANIFAVNAQGTQVFVNEEDTAGGKAMQTGFAVSGRKAAKDGSDLFTVGSTGTQVYIDEDATKAVRTGFAVSGRRGGAKDTDKYLEINTDGTHVYIDNEDDSTKAVRTGFAVSGRRGGAKDAAKYMEINADGTKVYVGADGKAIKTGFAVSGRRGGSKGKEIKLFEVNNFGTQIYIDAENTKAQRTGFAVSGRRGAAKDGNFDSNQDKYMVIDADGTVIYVDYEAAKAIQTGFAVSGRKAAKDGTQNTILKVDNAEGTHIYIEDVDGKVMPTGFAVSGRKAAKDGESDLMRITGDKTTITAKNLGMLDKESDKSMMSITSDSTKIITDDLQLLNHNDSTLLTTNNGNVEVMNDLVVLGDVAQTVDADTVEDALPIYMAVVERIDTIVCADTAPGLQAAKGYALLKIYGNGLFAQNQNIDAEGNNVILFDANGNPIQQHQAAAAAVILAKASTADAKLIVWPLKQVNNLKICFGLMAAGDTANRYVNVEAYVNASAPVECLVDVKAEVDSLGTVVVNGPKVYGEKVDLVPQPIEGYHFTKWTDGRQANPRTALILHDTAFASANFEINTYNIIAKAKNGKVEISGPWNADTTFNHGSKITLKAIPFENHHFMGWSDGDTAKLRQFTIKSDTTFEALFAIDSFNIKLQAKNGMVAGEGVYPYGTEIEISATADTAAGYHFVNWSDNIDDNPRKLTVTENLELTANFAINTYALTYKVDGEIFGDVETVEYGAPLTLRDSLVKEGYTFSGWSAIPETMPKNNVTVTGSWSINQYTITFKSDTNVVYTTIKQDYNTTFDMPKEEPVKTGYTFKGWSDTLTTIPAKDTTITAKWEINKYKVTFDTDGGTEIAAIEQDYNTAFDMLKNEPTKAGYSFKGWSDTLTTIPAMDITITAKWEIEKYKIEFDYNGGALAEGVTNQAEYTIESKDITLAEPSRIGYEFEGWEGTGLTGPTKNVIITKGSTGNRSYTAKWKIENYDISYILDNNASWASGCNPTVSYNYETETVTLPTSQNIACASHTFVGWVDAAGNAITGWNAHTRVGSLELTAQWTVNQYSVTFNANNASAAGSMNAESFTHGEQQALTANGFTLEGYTFKGWSEDATSTDATYTDAASITVDKPMVLYAVWEVNHHNLTWDANGGNALSGDYTNGPEVDYGTQITPPDAPTRAGYAFAGWATTANATTAETVATTMPDNDLTYYAVWFNAQLSSSTTTFWRGSTLSVDAAFKTNNGGAYSPDSEQLGWNLSLKSINGTATLAESTSANLTIPNGMNFTDGQQSILHAALNYNGTQIAEADFVLTADHLIQGMVAVKGATISGAIDDVESVVFVAGRDVTIPNLYVCDHEVTQAEYQAVMGINPSHFKDNPADGEVQENRPVEMVKWQDALAYCNTKSIIDHLTPCYSVNGDTSANALLSADNLTIVCDFNANGYRLPTEAEWEYIARGGNGLAGTQTTYSGSNTIGDVAWYEGNSDNKTHEVKKKAPNSLGIYDMTGNVAEWCWDLWHPESYSYGVRVLRGGEWGYSYNNDPIYVYYTVSTVAHSDGGAPGYVGSNDGFRIVRTVNDGPTTCIFVGENGDDTNTGSSVNSPLATISAAASKMNDVNNTNYTIYVNGTLTGSQTLSEEFNGKAKSITLGGLNTTDKLDGNNSGTVLTINTTVPVTVKNLTITGGNATNGGGIYCSAGSDVTLDNGAKVAGNIAQEKGGGVYVDGKVISNDTIRGKLTINKLADISDNNVVVVHSSGDDGGAGVYVNYGMMLLNGGEISNNYHGNDSGNSFNATTVNGRGGIRLQCAIFTMRDGKISGNKSGHMGGNIFSVASRIDICGGEISDGVIGYNNSSYDAVGSALLLDIKTVLNMSGGKIIGNKTWAGQNKIGRGAVVVCDSSIFNMSGGTISGNTIESGGNRYGSAVCVIDNGVFNISDSANIASNNDVHLNSDRIINITAPLDSALVATITPLTYATNQSVLSGDAALVASQRTKFAITPQINGTETIRWSISPDGKLLKADFVPVQGTYYDGSQRVDTSHIFIEGRRLAIQDLYACDHEVTQAEYEAVMGQGSNPSHFTTDPATDEVQSRRPVDNVNWYTAIAYCNKLSMAENLTPCYTIKGSTTPANWGSVPTENDPDWNAAECDFNANGYRLPTEAEWEYLARNGNLTGTQTAYSGSTSLDVVGWYSENSNSITHEVKQKEPNTLGLYDMSGNIWEWVWDWYSTSVDNNTAATGVLSGSKRAGRGGCWSLNSNFSQVAFLHGNVPEYINQDIGFRVVRTASNTDTCIITFNTNGGSAIAPMTVWNGYRLDVKPVKDALNFGGWYTDSELTKPFEGGSFVTSDTTLYAKWLSDFIEVPGTYFDGTETVATSVVFTAGSEFPIQNMLVCDHEVTQREWETVMGISQAEMDEMDKKDDEADNGVHGIGDNNPAYRVTWYAAIAYCNKRSLDEDLNPVYTVDGMSNENWGDLNYNDIPRNNDDDVWKAVTCDFTKNGYRLPTEAEWEYLARGGNLSNNEQTSYSGSDEIGDVAWYKGNSGDNGGDTNGKTHEVKTKAPNNLVLYDMSGNVWEWCWDSDLQSSTHERHTRGGSWDCWGDHQSTVHKWCNVNTRATDEPYELKHDLGLRVVRTVVSNETCQVTINNGTNPERYYVLKGYYITVPAIPTRAGYIFEGWYSDEECETPYNFKAAVTGDVTLYAKWKKIYAKVGGTFYSDLQSTISAISQVSEDVTIELYDAVKADELGKADEPNTIIYAVKHIQSQIGVTLVVPEGANIALDSDCSNMFSECSNLVSADLRGFNTSGVTNMSYMFYRCSALTMLDVSGFNTANVTNMLDMFGNCESLTTLDLSNFNTSNCSDIAAMFENCESLTTLDLSSFNTSKDPQMTCMFQNCPELTTIYAASGADWSGVGSSNNMFNGCTALEGGNGTKYNSSYIDATYARIDKEGQKGYFTVIPYYAKVGDVLYYDYATTIEAITNASGSTKVVIYKGTAGELGKVGTSSPSGIIGAIMSNSNAQFSFVVPEGANIVLSGDDCENMFAGLNNLISADLRGFNTSSVTNMSAMFWNCPELISLNITNFITNNVTRMDNMFVACYKLTTIDVSSFNTGKVEYMDRMFAACTELTTIYAAAGANWKTSVLKSSVEMFLNSEKLPSYRDDCIDATYARINGGETNRGYFTVKN